MTIHVGPLDIAHLSNRSLCRMLEATEQEERSLSDARAELHALIDSRHVEAGEVAEDDLGLATLEQTEREMSSQRLELHRRILELRMEKSRRIDGMRARLQDVERPALRRTA